MNDSARIDQIAQLAAHTISGNGLVPFENVVEELMVSYSLDSSEATQGVVQAVGQGYVQVQNGLLHISLRQPEVVAAALEVEAQFLEDLGQTEEAERVRQRIPLRYVDVTAASFLHDTVLHVTFSDGLAGELDVKDFFIGPLAEEILRDNRVSDFTLDQKTGTIVWFNGLDVAPERLWAAVLERRNPSSAHVHDWDKNVPLYADKTSEVAWEGPYECPCGKSIWLKDGVQRP